jgi:hypothetical protein
MSSHGTADARSKCMRLPSALASAVAPALGSTVVTTATSTASLLWFGKHYARSPWEPFDAISHIAWGDRAFLRDELDVRHTLVGFLLNVGAVAMWSALHGIIVGRRSHMPRAIPLALASGVVVAATAYVVDFKVVPKRVTPGFEKKLPARPLRKVYAILAVSFAAGSLLARAWR